MCAQEGRSDKSNGEKIEQKRRENDRMETKEGEKYAAGLTEFR